MSKQTKMALEDNSEKTRYTKQILYVDKPEFHETVTVLDDDVVTQPDQALSIAEIVRRMEQGKNPQMHETYYQDNGDGDPDYDSPDIIKNSHLDPVDREQNILLLEDELNRQEEKIKREETEKPLEVSQEKTADEKPAEK